MCIYFNWTLLWYGIKHYLISKLNHKIFHDPHTIAQQKHTLIHREIGIVFLSATKLHGIEIYFVVVGCVWPRVFNTQSFYLLLPFFLSRNLSIVQQKCQMEWSSRMKNKIRTQWNWQNENMCTDEMLCYSFRRLFFRILLCNQTIESIETDWNVTGCVARMPVRGGDYDYIGHKTNENTLIVVVVVDSSNIKSPSRLHFFSFFFINFLSSVLHLTSIMIGFHFDSSSFFFDVVVVFFYWFFILLMFRNVFLSLFVIIFLHFWLVPLVNTNNFPMCS